MKNLKYLSGMILVSILIGGNPDHIIFSEIVLQPSAGSYIVVQNPTAQTVDLSDYYITDGTDTEVGEYYYNLPTGVDYWSGEAFDFILRFPDGFSIAGGQIVVIGVSDSTTYNSEYGTDPDLTLKQSFRSAVTGASTAPVAPFNILDTSTETLILFHWDSNSTIVQDVDYLLWGDNSHAVSKSGVAGYLDDTPVENQFFMPIHNDGEKMVRPSSEGTEVQSDGNGITGHDETSENLNETWVISALTSSKPEISTVSVTPELPSVGDDITFTAVVTDDEGVSSVELVYTWKEIQTVSAMTSTGNDSYTKTLDGYDESGTLTWYIRAEDVSGLRDSTNINALTISPPPEDLSIADLLENLSDYVGEEVEIDGVITVPAGVLWKSRSQAYLQDESERGIILDKLLPLDESLSRGDSVLVTAEVEVYQGTPELIDYEITLLKSNADVPVVEIDISEFNTLDYMYTFVKMWGKITSRSNPSGTNTGANIDIQDETGEVTTVRIWNTTKILYNENYELVNLELDSLLQVGSIIEVSGIGGEYSGSSQVQPAFVEDIVEKLEGVVGDYSVSLKIAPYPFVPQLGEVISYTYSFPDNARIKLRVFDLSGRHITTLFDEFRGLSFYKEGEWDGRNELNEIVDAGIYILHLEATDRVTGKTSEDMVPVVVGTKF